MKVEESKIGTHCCSWCGESQLLVHDIVFPERNDEEDTKEASTNGEGNQPANILLRKVGKQIHAVHGRDGGHVENTQASSS